MRDILHVSSECYPAAKAGGLGDVVGALPKYLVEEGKDSSVVIPKYQTDWIKNSSTKTIFKGIAPIGVDHAPFTVEEVQSLKLGFKLFVVSIPGRFDRPGIYIDPWLGHAHKDEMERFMTFQIAVLEWLKSLTQPPKVIHCHDHHTGLIPFMMKECFRYESFKEIPSVLTIHNGEYQGVYPIDNYALLPVFNLEKIGLLDWNGALNSLAAGIKSAWRVTTVSEGYLKELREFCHGLETLLNDEKEKTVGILNGIDHQVWDPETDQCLVKNYGLKTVKSGKKSNRLHLIDLMGLHPDRPVFSFIGRLVREKGADLIPELIRQCDEKELKASFLVLGTGDPMLHKLFEKLNERYSGLFNARLEYNESLAHQIYAGSDFIMMPSRVEPCGLNQLYAMRYGTIPVVRNVGGLSNSVADLSEKGGHGIKFDDFNLDDFLTAVTRGIDLYKNKSLFESVRKKNMNLNYSWSASVKKYIKLYNQINT